MDEARYQKLLDRKNIGEQLKKFVEAHGRQIRDLKLLRGLSNLENYVKGRAAPGWEALVVLAQECGSDLATLVEFIDSGNAPKVATEIPPEHKKIVKLLLEILIEESDDADEAKDWIVGNIRTFHRAYVRKRR